ncbi:MAG: hypothetical protein LBJ17_01295 [Dysgonamonadaceae bacterium]|jgi:hypothetical protein|nr:hypothetical protein [Dysgonamonadaceae bacterium]
MEIRQTENHCLMMKAYYGFLAITGFLLFAGTGLFAIAQVSQCPLRRTNQASQILGDSVTSTTKL